MLTCERCYRARDGVEPLEMRAALGQTYELLLCKPCRRRVLAERRSRAEALRREDKRAARLLRALTRDERAFRKRDEAARRAA